MKFNEVSLQVKIVGALAVMFFVVLVSIIYINDRNQRRYITAEVLPFRPRSGRLGLQQYGLPDVRGDGKTIQQQMEEFKKST